MAGWTHACLATDSETIILPKENNIIPADEKGWIITWGTEYIPVTPWASPHIVEAWRVCRVSPRRPDG